METYLYVGGGKSTAQLQQSALVMVYGLESEEWTTLPPYSHMFFGMAVLNNQLLLIGGQQPTVGKICTTDQLGVLSEESQQWQRSPLPQCRPHTVQWLLLMETNGW